MGCGVYVEISTGRGEQRTKCSGCVDFVVDCRLCVGVGVGCGCSMLGLGLILIDTLLLICVVLCVRWIRIWI